MRTTSLLLIRLRRQSIKIAPTNGQKRQESSWCEDPVRACKKVHARTFRPPLTNQSLLQLIEIVFSPHRDYGQ